MPGFKAAAWICLGASSLSLIIAALRLGEMGIVGSQKGTTEDTTDEIKTHVPLPSQEKEKMSSETEKQGWEHKRSSSVTESATNVNVEYVA